MKLSDITKKQKTIEPFDYGSVSDEQKKALEECASLVEQSNPSLAALIRHKFYLKETKKIPLENSTFMKLAKEFRLNTSVQGWNTINATEDKEETHIPIVAITEDIRIFDEFLLFVLKKYNVKSF